MSLIQAHWGQLTVLAAPCWGCSQVSVTVEMIRLSQSRWFPWRRHLSRGPCQHLHHLPPQQQLAALGRPCGPSGSDLIQSVEAVSHEACCGRVWCILGRPKCPLTGCSGFWLWNLQVRICLNFCVWAFGAIKEQEVLNCHSQRNRSWTS